MEEGVVEFDNPEFDCDNYGEEEETNIKDKRVFQRTINDELRVAEQSPKEDRENMEEKSTIKMIKRFCELNKKSYLSLDYRNFF